MTTLAVKNGIMAGDKLCAWGSTPAPTTKVFIHEGLLVGVAGDKDNAVAFTEWVLAGRSSDSKPTFKTEGFSAIIVENGIIHQFNLGCFAHPVELPFWAAGSGADYALGAMAHGASAAEAVAIASTLDINTGLGVDVISLDGEQKRKPYEVSLVIGSLKDWRTP